jgi:BirA family biotin operon repressor/biotin-[acetyl-CoA-carboxylase] ligase
MAAKKLPPVHPGEIVLIEFLEPLGLSQYQTPMRRIHYDVIDSTNSEGRRLATMHPGERLLVTAATQSAGRGRHGRDWHSPLGGAWMSIVWPLCKAPREYAPISLVAAVALRRALAELVGDDETDFRVKWPNDLLLDNAKVAGILCEQFPGRGWECGGLLIIGIGVNVEFDPALLGRDLRQPATTLAAALGRSFDVEAVIAAVSRNLVTAMGTFEREGLSESLLDELRASLAYVGTMQTWTSPRGTITGRVLGVESSGRLLLERGGKEVACDVGEFVTSIIEPRSGDTW